MNYTLDRPIRETSIRASILPGSRRGPNEFARFPFQRDLFYEATTPSAVAMDPKISRLLEVPKHAPRDVKWSNRNVRAGLNFDASVRKLHTLVFRFDQGGIHYHTYNSLGWAHVASQVSALGSLPPNWDGNGAATITQECIQTTLGLMEIVEASQLVPHGKALPTADSGILFRASLHSRHYTFEVDHDCEIGLTIHESGVPAQYHDFTIEKARAVLTNASKRA